MGNYKIVALANFFLGLLFVALSIIQSMIVSPRITQVTLEAGLNTSSYFDYFYVLAGILFCFGIANLVFGFNLFIKKSENPNLLKSSKRGLNLLILSVLVLAVLVPVSAVSLTSPFYSTANTSGNSKSGKINNPSQDKNIFFGSGEQKITDTSRPRSAAFMREGDIYFLDIENSGDPVKISKTPKVSSPKLSPDGKYVYYFEIDHSTGGMPVYQIFVSDVLGEQEKTFSMLANQSGSKPLWSEDSTMLGVLLYDMAGELPQLQKANIYDTKTQELIYLGYATLPPGIQDEYAIAGSCSQVGQKYIDFCKKYTAYVKVPRVGDFLDQTLYRVSKYTEEGYKLSRATRIGDNKIVLEYYTGDPKNPEAFWGEGGGSYVVGYDAGVTETYTLLVDEGSGQVLYRLPQASEVDFLF
ncbi:hypothetical protein H6802_00470 [Candidatus Nomurabacteria bacterium]|uniref:DUF5050 domain-containing protein n=1 Tax=candidate division WWE3 bacterium TaxID=2053526 RepID=A0A955DZX1_UNCKA|nr:hypothetical protein [candidate division WWE3 bacterium]MCB9823423.1 hypothetical protein [Candidatus Nomurabacteria bacterium]MCB9827705.1 hypothetical protein [Candidatus Nomurabacteria bacterium]HXK52831.1 hypothetical protein [bacterium]